MKAADIPVAEPIIYNTDRMDQNTKRAGTQVDWKDMKIPRAKGGSLRNFLEDAEPNNGDPDQRLHEPQVEEWDAGEENEKPTKTHIPTEEESSGATRVNPKKRQIPREMSRRTQLARWML